MNPLFLIERYLEKYKIRFKKDYKARTNEIVVRWDFYLLDYDLLIKFYDKEYCSNPSFKDHRHKQNINQRNTIVISPRAQLRLIKEFKLVLQASKIFKGYNWMMGTANHAHNTIAELQEMVRVSQDLLLPEDTDYEEDFSSVYKDIAECMNETEEDTPITQ